MRHYLLCRVSATDIEKLQCDFWSQHMEEKEVSRGLVQNPKSNSMHGVMALTINQVQINTRVNSDLASS